MRDVILHIRTLSLLGIMVVVTAFSAFSQSAGKLIREGNKLYDAKNFTEAELKYRKANDKDKKSFESIFNLGDALYKQGKYDEAAEQFRNLTNLPADKEKLAQTYHNLGNAYLKNKKYEESIQAYKNALKNNSSDPDTKYNLAYAKAMLKQQQQQQNKDNKNNKDDKKNKDKQKDEEKKDDKDQKDDKRNDQQDQDKDQKADQKKPEKGKISKEDAQRMLDALNEKEKEAQKKLGKKESQRVQIEKDW